MKRLTIVVFAFILVFSFTACNQDQTAVSSKASTEMNDSVVLCLSSSLDQFDPSIERIAGSIEYWSDGNFVVYYVNTNQLYYSNVSTADNFVKNHGLVLTDNLLKPIDSEDVVYVDGMAVAKKIELPYISFEKFVASMDYSFDDARNSAAQKIATDFVTSHAANDDERTAIESLDYLKCDYLSQMIKHELLSDPATKYASVYDDATITDCHGNWYEICFSAEVYQVMSRLTDKVICYAWAYSNFDFENGKLVDVRYESFFNAPYEYFYITYRLADEGFTDVEIQDCRDRIGWGTPVSREISSEVSLWGTVHSNEYHTDFWLDESVLIQIGDMQYDISRIEIDDPYLFPTMVSGKPINEYDGEHLLLTGTITSASEDFSLVKFYTLRESVIGEDNPFSAPTTDYQTELTGYVRYNEAKDLCDIVLSTPTELTTINGFTALAEKVRVWPVNYNFANDNIMNYVGQAVLVQGLIDYEFGMFTIRPTAITTFIDVPQQDLEVMYNNALDAVDTYLACCGEIAPYAERNSIGAEAYMTAKSSLLACGDYEHAQYWLNCINAIEDLCVSARDANMMITNGVSSYSAPAIGCFSVSVSDDLITIQNNNLYAGEGTKLTLSYSFDQTSFTATISPVYNDHMKGVDGEALRIVVALFTKIYNDEDLKISLIESFSDDEHGKSVVLDWGGYHLEIVTAGEYDYNRTIIVTGTRNS